MGQSTWGLSDSVTDESEICVFIPSKRLE